MMTDITRAARILSPQIFVLPSCVLSSHGIRKPVPGATQHHSVNFQLLPNIEVTKESTLKIGRRALETFITSSTRPNIAEAFDFAAERGVEFNLTYISQEFSEMPSKPFDAQHMRALFDYGSENGAVAAWRKRASFSGDPGQVAVRLLITIDQLCSDRPGARSTPTPTRFAATARSLPAQRFCPHPKLEFSPCQLASRPS